MAALIPSLNSCLGKMTPGERRFARRLEDLLEDDYTCWYELPVGLKRQRYADFLILHPARGLLVLEVKDWKLENLKRLTLQHVDLLTPQGLKRVANPREQVRQCAYKLVQELERDPQLREASGNYQGKLCFPYGYGVVLTNITRAQWNKALPAEYQERMLPAHQVICKDEMTEAIEAEAFQERLWGMFNYQFGGRLTLPQIDRVRWHLFPEVRIDAQPDLFASDVDESPVLPDIVRVMDLQQEQLARSLGEGHRVIHGVAGSGKTMILGYRCLYLSEVLNKPTLVLCFNITLAAKLRSFIEQNGIEHKVQVYHFHDWCGEQLRTYHIDLLPGDAPVWERQVTSVIDAVERETIPRAQYGAVLIDEGHDFEPDWLRLVTQMIDPASDSLLLLYDDAQSIYRKRSGLGFSLASVGVQAQGRTTVLRLNYRNTREILEFAYRFAKDSFDQHGNGEIPLIEPETAGITGEPPAVRHFDALEQEIVFAMRCLQRWHEAGLSWREMAVLYPSGEAGKLMARALTTAGIPHFWLASRQYKKKYRPDEERVSLMAVPSSKGLEFENVILLDSSRLPKSIQAEETIADATRLLYVGMTRARKHLVVSHHRKTALAERLAGC